MSQPKTEKTYLEQVWHYLVRIWVGDHLQVATNGQTDNATVAFQMAMDHPRPAQVYDVWQDKIIYRNY